MPITAPTKTTDAKFSGYIQPRMAEAYFDEALKRSVAMQLASKKPLGLKGEAIPVATTKPQAFWVEEGAQKQATERSQTLVPFSGKKIAAIAVVSEEVVKMNPANYLANLKAEIGEAFALSFDLAFFHGKNQQGGASPFTTNLDQTTNSVALGTATAANGGVYTDLNGALSLLVNSTPPKKLTGYAFDGIVEPVFNGSLDVNGRPIFIDSPVTGTSITPGSPRGGRLLGRSAYISDPGAISDGTVVGYAGDWSKAIWGQVGGIEYRVSKEATVTINGTLTSLWENNLVAILMEAFYGILIYDPAAFVKFTVAP